MAHRYTVGFNDAEDTLVTAQAAKLSVKRGTWLRMAAMQILTTPQDELASSNPCAFCGHRREE